LNRAASPASPAGRDESHADGFAQADGAQKNALADFGERVF
jgi:hypothetical protein